MALIKCPECSTEVSDRAAACPKCAHPLGATVNPVVGQVVVEQTSKAIKLHYLASLFAIAIGCSVAFGGAADGQKQWGALLWLGGLVWLIITKARRWWHHD